MRARCHSYLLFSRLLLEGITDELLPIVQQVAPLARLLPTAYNADAAAADHYDLFGLNVYAYESTFLESKGDGQPAAPHPPVAYRLAQFYRQTGYELSAADCSADHLAHELELLAYLAAAEAAAEEERRADRALRSRQLQRDFLASHLLRWLPTLAIAVRQQGHDFYSGALTLLLQLVEDHALSLGAHELLPQPAGAWLPSVPALLADERTALRDIATYLTTPASCGLYVSRDTLRALARSLRLPQGFGGRRQLMHNLLQTAAQFEQLPPLLHELASLCRRWEQAYAGAIDAALAPFIVPWQEQTRTTRALLTEMAAMAERLPD